jgi:hypothetical protein
MVELFIKNLKIVHPYSLYWTSKIIITAGFNILLYYWLTKVWIVNNYYNKYSTEQKYAIAPDFAIIFKNNFNPGNIIESGVQPQRA